MISYLVALLSLGIARGQDDINALAGASGSPAAFEPDVLIVNERELHKLEYVYYRMRCPMR